MLKILSEYSCSLTLPNAQGQIPLHYLFSNKAACRDKVRVMKEMKKIQIYFWRPFQTPVKEEILEAIGYLLGRGVNAFHKDNFGSTPLDWLNSYCQLTDDVKEAVQEKFQEGTVFYFKDKFNLHL